jgi:hypothetical protein
MSLSFPITVPSGSNQGVTSVSWLEENTMVIKESAYSKVRQVQNWGGERWRINVAVDPMDRANAQAWMAFLSALRGGYGTFLFGDPVMRAPLAGAPSGTPLVKGAGQVGYQLAIDGCTPSGLVLSAGDFFEVANRIYRSEVDVTADGSGEATIDIWPHARSPLDNAPLVFTDWRGLFFLDTITTETTTTTKAGVWPINFSAVEAL